MRCGGQPKALLVDPERFGHPDAVWKSFRRSPKSLADRRHRACVAAAWAQHQWAIVVRAWLDAQAEPDADVGYDVDEAERLAIEEKARPEVRLRPGRPPLPTKEHRERIGRLVDKSPDHFSRKLTGTQWATSADMLVVAMEVGADAVPAPDGVADLLPPRGLTFRRR